MMAWQELTPSAPSSNAAAAAPVRFGLTKMGGSVDARARLLLSLDLLESLVETAPEQWRFRLYVGGGESAGWLRVEPHADGLFIGRPSSRGRTIIVPFDRPAGYPNQARNSEPVPHRRVGSAIEVRLIALRAAAAAAFLDAAAAAERPTTSPLPPRPPAEARDVTAGLMGDPKPGRSAADQKKGA